MNFSTIDSVTTVSLRSSRIDCLLPVKSHSCLRTVTWQCLFFNSFIWTTLHLITGVSQAVNCDQHRSLYTLRLWRSLHIWRRRKLTLERIEDDDFNAPRALNLREWAVERHHFLLSTFSERMFTNRQKTIGLFSRWRTRGNFILTLIIGSVLLFVLLRGKTSTLPLPSAAVPLPLPVSNRSSSLIFWAINNHDGCRVDTATLLQGLNQTVIITDHVGRKNPYLSAFTRPHIVFLRETHALAPVIDSHRGHSDSLVEEDVKAFFSFYHNDSVMSTVNAFYCSFPMSLCEIYMPLNRSIIWLPAHRFTLARCSRPELDRLISHLQQSVQADQQPKHFLAAGGRYDQEYIKYYTGLDAILLPTNAFWYAFNVTRWTEARSEILVGPLQHSNYPLIQRMTGAARMRKSPFRFATAKNLYGHYELQQIADHRAIVLLPYAVLSYGITELYALGIPIFIPSIEFLVQLKLVSDRTLLDDSYCGKHLKFTDLPNQHPRSNHPHSPEDRESIAAMNYWLQFADYYQWPHIQRFVSWEDLIDKLSKTDFSKVHQRMFEENVERRTRLVNDWQKILAQIDPHPRPIPKDYQTAIRQLWNTSQLQAF